MKKMKKIVSILLTAIMVLSMAFSAFAENYTITAPENGHTYEIFQIFTGDYSSSGVLSNVKWGINGKGEEGTSVDDDILSQLAAVKDSSSNTDKLAVIQQYVDIDGTPYATIDENTEDLSVEVPAGYYLIKDKDETVGANDFYTTYIVEIVGDITIAPKGSVPEVDKKIVEGDVATDSNAASIGDRVNYEITGTLPTNFDDYKEYYFVFTDTLSKGLTLDSDTIKVEVSTPGHEDVDVTDCFYISSESIDDTTDDDTTDNVPTKLTVGIQNLKWLKDLNSDVELNKDTVIVLTYQASINEDAVIGSGGNENKVKLDYYNNPNNSGDGETTPPEKPDEPEPKYPTGETPEDQVFTYTTELTILKQDDSGNILTGAEFTLKGNSLNVVLVESEKFIEAVDGTYWRLIDGTYTEEAPVIDGDEKNDDAYESITQKYKKDFVTERKETVTQTGKVEVTAEVGLDGRVTFRGLGAGTYTIEETTTPEGYNTIDPIVFTIGFDPDEKEFTSNNEKIEVEADNTLTTTIVNKKGTTLPTTGGAGTTMFYIIGSILAIGAAVLLITKRRMSAGNKQ